MKNLNKLVIFAMTIMLMVTSSLNVNAESVSLKDKNFEYSIDKNTEGTKGIFITKYIGSDKKLRFQMQLMERKLLKLENVLFPIIRI